MCVCVLIFSTLTSSFSEGKENDLAVVKSFHPFIVCNKTQTHCEDAQPHEC